MYTFPQMHQKITKTYIQLWQNSLMLTGKLTCDMFFRLYVCSFSLSLYIPIIHSCSMFCFVLFFSYKPRKLSPVSHLFFLCLTIDILCSQESLKEKAAGNLLEFEILILLFLRQLFSAQLTDSPAFQTVITQHNI